MRYHELIENNLSSDLWYHGSVHRYDIAHCKPFTHFGTKESAWDRGYSKARQMSEDTPIYIYVVKLNLGKSLSIRDGKNMQHTEITLIDMLHYTTKTISSEERNKLLSSSDQFSKLAEILRSKGYDSLNYKNKYEDYGSTSVIIFDNSQVKLVETLVYNINGRLRE